MRGIPAAGRGAQRHPRRQPPLQPVACPQPRHRPRSGACELLQRRDGRCFGRKPAAADTPPVSCRRRQQRPAPAPRHHNPPAVAHLNEASSRVHSRSPVRPSPCLWLPDGAGALGREPRASHPAVTRDARQGGDGPRTLIRGYITVNTGPPDNEPARYQRLRVAPPDRCPLHWAGHHLAAIIIPGQSGTYRHLQGRVTDLFADSGLTGRRASREHFRTAPHGMERRLSEGTVLAAATGPAEG